MQNHSDQITFSFQAQILGVPNYTLGSGLEFEHLSSVTEIDKYLTSLVSSGKCL